jgi:hypothetical protein
MVPYSDLRPMLTDLIAPSVTKSLSATKISYLLPLHGNKGDKVEPFIPCLTAALEHRQFILHSFNPILITVLLSKCQTASHFVFLLSSFLSRIMELSYPQVAALAVTLLVLVAIVALLRCDIRYRVLKNYGWEDIFVIFAWVCLHAPSTRDLSLIL